MSKDAILSLDPATLPDDPTLLKRLVIERTILIQRIREEAAEQLDAQRQRLEAEHKAAMAAVLRRLYAPKTERFDPRQLLLFGRQVEELAAQLEASQGAPAAEFDTETPVRKQRRRHEHGRHPLPDSLPRIEIDHDLGESEKPCPCCGEVRVRIGQEVSEQLEIIPASFKVLKHVRHKYGCPRCEREAENPQIVTAAKPPQPIEKGLPGPGLLAYLITSKSGQHLPLYRLEDTFARSGVNISRSTMCGWLAAVGELVRPLVELLGRRIRTSKVIHTDDTRVPVQAPGQCKNGHLWTYIGDVQNPYLVYDFTPDRTRAGPAHWLGRFQGYLQADAYGGYDGIYSGGGVTEVACWAHARRKFFEARETDTKRAAQMLELVRQLYAVEDEARKLNDEQRRALRQAQSKPVLTRIKAWLDEEGQVVLPRSELGQAFTYTLNQWEALNVYVTEGYLNIDNNAAERAMKRVALGRKNWLFAGNDYAGGTAARLYSLVASAERHGLDPQRYLTSVLAQLPCTPEADLERLLPDVWKRADAAEAAAAPSPSSRDTP